MKCKKQSETYAPFCHLGVVPHRLGTGAQSLQVMISNYFSADRVSLKCTCKHETATRVYSVYKSPLVLTVQVKR